MLVYLLMKSYPRLTFAERLGFTPLDTIPALVSNFFIFLTV